MLRYRKKGGKGDGHVEENGERGNMYGEGKKKGKEGDGE